jgi:23S rRNA pseudouridine1911/1915/1917 synthase
VTRRIEIAAPEDGLRLDVCVGAHPEVGSRAAAQRLIDQGRVSVAGEPRPKRHRLAAGDVVTVELAEAPPETGPVQVPHSVVHEDDHLLVVDKPAGVVVHPAPGYSGPTLAQALAGRARGGPDPERAGIVHRLDRETSGLLLVAKSEEAHGALQRAIRERRVERSYLALVEGHPDAASGTIDAPLGRDRARRERMSTRTDEPRQAVTHFERLEALPRTTLLAVALETGRTHQIRAHMEAIGHPVCGDPQYGGARSGERLGLARQFLHAAGLRLEHPVTGERLALESPLPADLAAALERARAEQAAG